MFRNTVNFLKVFQIPSFAPSNLVKVNSVYMNLENAAAVLHGFRLGNEIIIIFKSILTTFQSSIVFKGQ